MLKKAYLIPPNSHFLKTLINYFSKELNFLHPEVSKYLFVFPTKRASYFFKFYLSEKIENSAFFLPQVYSWEEFLQFLYLELSPSPSLLYPDSTGILLFLESLKRSPIDEFLNEKEEKLLFWAEKFLEVFEEFEKEGKTPKDVPLPPEEVPEPIRLLLENLSKLYENFKALLKEKKILLNNFLYAEILELLKTRPNSLKDKIKGLYFCGFGALRRAEREIIEALLKILSNKEIKFFFETNPEPHPIISYTLRELNLVGEVLPENHFDKPLRENKVYFFSFPDFESEIKKLSEFLESRKRPDEMAIILPSHLTLLPLLRILAQKDLEVNITLPYPLLYLSLNQLLLSLLKIQRERQDKAYPTEKFLKILRHPLVLSLFQENNFYLNLFQTLSDFLLKERPFMVSKEELLSPLDTLQKESFLEFYTVFFENWEDLKDLSDLKRALFEFLDVFKPLLSKLTNDEGSIEEYLHFHYLSFLEKEILPLFDLDIFSASNNKNFWLNYLEYLLSRGSIPLFGEPLKGLQILGFLESRLLSFEKVIVLDVNEGILPPSSSINPLLTDEMKRIFGLPLYHNEIWDYYFERLLYSSQETNLFYIETSQGKTELYREPSRFIHKWKWYEEKTKKKPFEEKVKLTFHIPGEREYLRKGEEDQRIIKSYLEKGEISRSFLETYLACPIKFYFKYVLNLKDFDEAFLLDREIGDFIHKFFERLFRDYLYKNISFKELVENKSWEDLFDNLWKELNFEKKFDPLNLFLSEKISKACIEKYFTFLAKKEEDGKLKNCQILGIENELSYETNFKENSLEIEYPIKFYGRVDFIIKRVERIPTYLILDFKSNPEKEPAPKSLDKLVKFKPPENFERESLKELKSLFGKNLTNFQLLFYLFLFLKKASNFGVDFNKETVDAGYLRPSNFTEPEKLLLENKVISKRQLFLRFLEREFEKLLHYLLKHLLLCEVFYFTEDKNECKFCSYRIPCQNLRVRRERLEAKA